MSKVRVWAAIEPVPGVIVAEVRDVEHAVVDGGSNPAYRPWGWCALDEKGRANCRDTNAKDCGCRPGTPCPHAHTAAARWWPRWQELTDTRVWRARRFRPNIASVDDWGEKRDTAKEAIEDARLHGMPFVVLVDGHYNEIERREVS